MPALILFNRRTIFAGDDLQPTSILTCIAHMAQLVLLSIPILVHLYYEGRFILKVNLHDSDEGEDGILQFILDFFFGYGDIFNIDETKNENDDDIHKSHDLKLCNQRAHYFPLFLCLYLICTNVHIVSSLILEGLIYRISSIGTPTQPELRNEKLSILVQRKWVWSSIIGNVIVLSLAVTSLCFTNLYFSCRQELLKNENIEYGKDEAYYDFLSLWFGRLAWKIAIILLMTSQAVQLVVSSVSLNLLLQKEKVKYNREFGLGFYSGYVRPNSHDEEDDGDDNNHNYSNAPYHSHSPQHQHLHHHELVEEMWDQRCRAFCHCAARSTCYLFGGRELVDGIVGDYGPVSRALADYFEDGGVLDIVVSDIAVGFMMLQRRQRQRVLAARRSINDDLKCGKPISDENLNGEQIRNSKNKRLILSSSHGLRERNVSSGSLSSVSEMNEMSSTSTLDCDTHSFGLEHQRISSILQHDLENPNFNLSELNNIDGATATDTIPQYQNTTATTMTNRDALLMSILQPMPYASMLLLPNGQFSNSNSATDYVNTPTAAWTLKKITTGSESGEGNYEVVQRKVFNRNDAIDTNAIAEGARFARHSLSIYTWVLYVYMKPLAGPPNLIYNRMSEFCKQCIMKNTTKTHTLDNNILMDVPISDEERNSFFCNIAHGNTMGDNCFHVHRNSLLAHSGLDESDLIYANFNNKYNQMPYCIVIDHKWQSVVLAIRGTLSLEDCLVDVLVEPDPLDELGREYNFDAKDQYCHSGVLSCVKYILNDLKR
jgi:hypothetical protein